MHPTIMRFIDVVSRMIMYVAWDSLMREVPKMSARQTENIITTTIRITWTTLYTERFDYHSPLLFSILNTKLFVSFFISWSFLYVCSVFRFIHWLDIDRRLRFDHQTKLFNFWWLFDVWTTCFYKVHIGLKKVLVEKMLISWWTYIIINCIWLVHLILLG